MSTLARLGLLVAGELAKASEVNSELDNLVNWLQGGNLTATHVQAGGLTSAVFTDNTLDGVKLLANSVPAAKVVTESLAGGSGGQIAQATITALNLAAAANMTLVDQGTYDGDGGADVDVDVGFEPDLVLVIAYPTPEVHGTTACSLTVQLISMDPYAIHISGAASVTMHNDIVSVAGYGGGTTGFAVYASPHGGNAAGYQYHWFAFAEK